MRRADRDASLSYEESWGGVLGPATHWRCKVCADGVGESADVVAADFWRVDERGYPVFTEGPGSSALIARTERGLDAVLAAEAAGALVLRPIRMAELANVQPLQRNRRTSLFGRLLGSRLAGVPGPRYRGLPAVGAGAGASAPQPARRARHPRPAPPVHACDRARAVNAPDGDAGAGTDRLALVVVNFAASGLIAANLADAALRGVVDDVVIVDNPSSPEETRRIRELCAANGWDLVELPWNEGFGAGINAGVARAGDLGCTRVLALNPDATIDPGSIRALLDASRADPEALVGPRIVRSDGTAWFAGAVLDPEHGTTRRARDDELGGDRTWQTGACFLATIAMWDAVGGFDDDYFMYWEDIDLSWRWREAGGALGPPRGGDRRARRRRHPVGRRQVPAVRVLQLQEPAPVRPEAARLPTRPPLVAGQRRVRLERRDARQPADAGEASAAALARRSEARSRARSGPFRRRVGEPSNALVREMRQIRYFQPRPCNYPSEPPPARGPAVGDERRTQIRRSPTRCPETTV